MSVYCPALEQALASHRKPSLALQLRDRELPDGIQFLLRVVSGDTKARAQASAASGEPEEVVLEAVVLFIQQVMLFPGSDSYRVLGASADVEDRQLKEHHRLLVRWLHPDRNDNAWEAIYADRVNRAWQELRTPERRALVATRSAAGAPVNRAARVPGLASPSRRGVEAADDGFLLSANTTRRLPTLILGSLAVGAALLLLMQYHLMQSDDPDATLDLAREPREPQATIAPLAARPAVAAPLPAIAPSTVKQSSRAPLPEVSGAVLGPEIAKSVPDKAPPSRAVPPSEVSSPPAVPLVMAPAAESSPATAEPAQPQVQAVRAQLIDEASAQALIVRFRSAFASGNIGQMRALLASEPLAVRGEREQILGSYDDLFASSASRRIQIENVSWLTQDDRAILIASYRAWVVPNGAAASRSSTGDIRFDLREQGGELRIVQLRQQPSRGTK